MDRATPLLAWANPADITYGTPLAPPQLDATTTVPGTFVYSQPAGTVLSAGAGQELSVTFTPTDTTDYTSVAATVTINVNKAVLTVTAADVSMTYGSSLPALTDTITGFVNGDDADVVSGTPGLSTTASSSSPPGSDPINVDVSGLSAANYSFAGPDPTLTIEKVTPTITWAIPPTSPRDRAGRCPARRHRQLCPAPSSIRSRQAPCCPQAPARCCRSRSRPPTP